MIINLESEASREMSPFSMKDARILGIRSYDSGNGDYKADRRDKVEYSCDAACDNCHCATF